jgi:hypothetical protein
MTDDSDLAAGIDDVEGAGHDEMGARLRRERPVPAAGFRGALRARLAPGRRSPGLERWIAGGRWRPLAATYSCLGAVLLAVAAIGLAGVGPFAS